MQGVEFNEEEQDRQALDPFRQRNTSKITGWILSTGFVKTPRQANLVLFFLLGLFILLTIKVLTR